MGKIRKIVFQKEWEVGKIGIIGKNWENWIDCLLITMFIFLGKAISAESGVNFLVISGADIMSKWTGASEGRVLALFEAIREETPIILFIDELESFLSHRTGENDSRNAVVTAFLKQTDSAYPKESNKNMIIIGGKFSQNFSNFSQCFPFLTIFATWFFQFFPLST